MPLGQKIARRWDVSTSVKTEQIQQKRWRKADRNLQIHGLGLALGCGPRNLEGLCLGARCTPVVGNGSECSPPPSAPSPPPCTLYLWTVEGKGMERRKRRRRKESDPASFYPSCDTNIEDGCEWLKNTVLWQKSSEVQVVVYWVVIMVTGDMTDFFQFFLLHTNKLNLKSEQIKASFITSTFKL